MVKSVIKEICIMLLLCVAIVLILGVIFYDYIPTNKAVPSKLEAYVTPENVQSEIEEEITQINKVEVTYQITGSDLNLYKSGKRDPFSASPQVDENIENTQTNPGGSETGNGETNSNLNTDPNSTGTFFNETGLK